MLMILGGGEARNKLSAHHGSAQIGGMEFSSALRKERITLRPGLCDYEYSQVREARAPSECALPTFLWGIRLLQRGWLRVQPPWLVSLQKRQQVEMST